MTRCSQYIQILIKNETFSNFKQQATKFFLNTLTNFFNLFFCMNFFSRRTKCVTFIVCCIFMSMQEQEKFSKHAMFLNFFFSLWHFKTFFIVLLKICHHRFAIPEGLINGEGGFLNCGIFMRTNENHFLSASAYQGTKKKHFFTFYILFPLFFLIKKFYWFRSVAQQRCQSLGVKSKFYTPFV